MSLKDNDYGYFGKGMDGYIHYKLAFDRNFGGSRTVGPAHHAPVKPAANSKPPVSADTTSESNHTKSSADKSNYFTVNPIVAAILLALGIIGVAYLILL